MNKLIAKETGLFGVVHRKKEASMARTPLYAKIRNDLRTKIEQGEYAVGEVIPSEVELAETYGVSRPTVRQAVQALADEGYLDKRRKRGTQVRQRKIEQGFTLTIRSFEEEMKANRKIGRTEVLALRRENPSDEVVRRLEIDPRDEVFKLVRLRYADDVPNVFNESYIPAALVPTFDTYDFQSRSMYDVLNELGEKVVSAVRSIDVVGADPTLAALLDVEEGDPCFLFHTVAKDAADRVVEYSIAKYRGESNTFEVRINS